jgi:hypothetical protein
VVRTVTLDVPRLFPTPLDDQRPRSRVGLLGVDGVDHPLHRSDSFLALALGVGLRLRGYELPQGDADVVERLLDGLQPIISVDSSLIAETRASCSSAVVSSCSSLFRT